jgi:oligosaccharide repeat unit polymerase
MINLFSPLFLVFISLITATAFWFIPKSYYLYYLGEPSYYTHNPLPLIWIIASILSFVLGCCIASVLIKPHRISKFTVSETEKRVVIMIPLLLSLAYIVGLSESLGGFKQYLAIAFGGGSDSYRAIVYNELESLNIGWMPQAAFPFVALCTYLFFAERIRRSYMIYGFTIIMYIFMILPNQTKASLISIIVTILFSYVLSQKNLSLESFRKTAIYLIFALASSIFLFIFIQSGKQGRDFSSLDGIIKEVMGYGPASFNRLGALLEGDLKIPNSNMGYYTNTWYWDSPIINSTTIVLENLEFDIPQPAYTNWLATFDAVGAYRLNKNYIWVTTYGEVYADYGYYGIIWFAVYGLISQIAWINLRNNTVNMVIYIVIFNSLIQLYSTASIGNKTILFAAIALYGLNLSRKIVLKKKTERKIEKGWY